MSARRAYRQWLRLTVPPNRSSLRDADATASASMPTRLGRRFSAAKRARGSIGWCTGGRSGVQRVDEHPVSGAALCAVAAGHAGGGGGGADGGSAIARRARVASGVRRSHVSRVAPQTVRGAHAALRSTRTMPPPCPLQPSPASNPPTMPPEVQCRGRPLSTL